MFQPGDQIAYIPTHAAGDIAHPDAEFGFVAKLHPNGTAAWCRYWRRGAPGTLRTLANSELTALIDLVRHDSVPQAAIDAWLVQLGYRER